MICAAMNLYNLLLILYQVIVCFFHVVLQVILLWKLISPSLKIRYYTGTHTCTLYMHSPKICHRQRVLRGGCSPLLLCSSEVVQLHWERMPNQIYYWQSSAWGAKKKQIKNIFEIEPESLDSVQSDTMHQNYVHVNARIIFRLNSRLQWVL